MSNQSYFEHLRCLIEDLKQLGLDLINVRKIAMAQGIKHSEELVVKVLGGYLQVRFTYEDEK
jgi:hypothetical protein